TEKDAINIARLLERDNYSDLPRKENILHKFKVYLVDTMNTPEIEAEWFEIDENWINFFNDQEEDAIVDTFAIHKVWRIRKEE
ncbi:hypothetical protein LCGC14_1686330, partial [marine sediment metagenome]